MRDTVTVTIHVPIQLKDMIDAWREEHRLMNKHRVYAGLLQAGFQALRYMPIQED